jgi:cell division protein FtsX
VNSSGAYYTKLYFVQGMRMLNRNRFWSLLTGIIIALLLFVVYIMVATAAHTRQAAQKVDDQLVVTALVAQNDKDYKSLVPAAQLAQQVRKLPYVKAVHVVSEKEAQQRFVRNLKDLKSAPAAWVFAEALEISVTDTNRMSQVRNNVLKINGIEQATYLEDMVQKLSAVSDYLRRMALIGAALLTLIAVMVVMAVVRTAIHSEQHSVSTMSSVGGSLWSITAPLLVYLLSVTLMASFLACVAGWWLDPKIAASFGHSLRNLPSWLITGRSYALLQLWPAFSLGACLAVGSIVCWGTWRYTRDPSVL